MLKHILVLCLSIILCNICYSQHAPAKTGNKKKADTIVAVKTIDDNSDTAVKTWHINPIFNNGAFNTLNYQPLKCAGKIPADFITLSSDKYNQAKHSIAGDDDPGMKEVKKKFYMESTYGIDELLLSGKVVFNDEVTRYLNKILDVILLNDKVLRDSIRIYTLKSTEVNALTTHNGIILVTTGLLAHVQNEAQLAYILCHEVIHFKNHHSISRYVEGVENANRKGVYADMNAEQRKIAAYGYSKDQETEADMEGLLYFKKSPYSLPESVNAFRMLQHAHHPYSNIAFDKTFFNSGYYNIPDSFFLAQVTQVADTLSEQDIYSTHPDINKRIRNILNLVGANYTDGKAKYIISEAGFHHIQYLCRIEDCLDYLALRNYGRSFYDAYVLLQSEPDNLFLHKIIAQSLYGAAKYKSNGRFTEMQHRKDSLYPGNIEVVYHLMHKMRSKELTVLALRYAEYVHMADKNDEQMSLIVDDMLYELTHTHLLRTADFVSMQLLKTTSTDTSDTNKYAGPLKYYEYGIAEFFDDMDFLDRYHKALNAKHGRTVSDARRTRRGAYVPVDWSEKALQGKYRLGLNDMIMVDPTYYKIDQTKTEAIRYKAAEDAEINLQNRIQDCANRTHVNITSYLETKNLGEDDVDKFNDIAMCNAWTAEQLSHGTMYYVNSKRPYTIGICNKYHSDNIAHMNVTGYTLKKRGKGIVLAVTAIYFPLFPFGVYYVATKDNNTLIYMTIGDVRNNYIRMAYLQRTHLKDLNSTLNSNLYFIMQQIHAHAKN